MVKSGKQHLMHAKTKDLKQDEDTIGGGSPLLWKEKTKNGGLLQLQQVIMF